MHRNETPWKGLEALEAEVEATRTLQVRETLEPIFPGLESKKNQFQTEKNSAKNFGEKIEKNLMPIVRF